MLVLRIGHGIREHFPARRSEWVLAGIMTVWGLILVGPEPVFTTKVWAPLAALADESIWGWGAIAVGTLRLLALVINGTFAETWYGRWSPHVRSLMSLLSCGLWFQIAWGLFQSDVATTGLSVYPGLLVLDLMNVVAAASDAGKMDKARRDESA